MATDFADVIGPETRVRGHIEGSAPLLVRGRVEGTVALREHLVIASEGHVNAEVQAHNVTVEGTAEGKLVASERVTVRAGAFVSAEVHTPALVVEDGARVVGRIEMNVELPDGVSIPGGRG